MQFFKLIVAMSAMVSAQHDGTKCNGDSTGTDSCCASNEGAADCDDYVIVFVEGEACSEGEAGSATMSKFYCDPPTETEDETEDEPEDETEEEDEDSSSTMAAGAGIVTTTLLLL